MIDGIDVKQYVGCGAKLCFLHVQTSERPRITQGNSHLFAASKLTQLSASPKARRYGNEPHSASVVRSLIRSNSGTGFRVW